VRVVFHPFFKSCSMQWNRQAFDKSRVGRLHRNDERPELAIRLSARTMAGAHITESDTTDKMLPR